MNDMRERLTEVLDERDKAREQVARLEADRQAAFKVGYQLTLDCQSLEEMTTTLVALCRTARADRDAMELARIADVADHCAAVQQRDAAQARVRELEQRVADLKCALGDDAGWFDRFQAAQARVRELEGLVVRVSGVAQALLERMDMDAGLGLLRFQTHEWSERVECLRSALREVKP